MKIISIRVSAPDYEEFRRASRRLNQPISGLIREAVEHYRR